MTAIRNDDFPDAKEATAPVGLTRRGTNLDEANAKSLTSSTSPRPPDLRAVQQGYELHHHPDVPVGIEQVNQRPCDTHGDHVDLFDPALDVLAGAVDDLEKLRIGLQHRVRVLTLTGPDADGVARGFGLDDSHPAVSALRERLAEIATTEHKAVLAMRRAFRQHPLADWQKRPESKGVGEKQLARLLSAIKDPYWNDRDNRPRLVSELWAYAGHGDANRRIRKSISQADLFACGSPIAKARVHLITESCVKSQGHYAEVYYTRKAQTEGRTHAHDCVRCGPSGHPARAGSAWSDAHRHADALRIVGKELLRDLWSEARRLHMAAS
jgi:hypothetical protein